MMLSTHTFFLTEKCTEGEPRFKESPVRQNSPAVAEPVSVATHAHFPKLLLQASRVRRLRLPIAGVTACTVSSNPVLSKLIQV